MRGWTQHEPAAFAAVVAEDHVLGDGERRDEAEVLVHHADPRVERVVRRVELDRLAVEADLALVGPVEPGEDVRERALARAVLAEQRVHLALGRLEVDAVVRDDGREPLRDPRCRRPARPGGAGREPGSPRARRSVTRTCRHELAAEASRRALPDRRPSRATPSRTAAKHRERLALLHAQLAALVDNGPSNS